MMLTREQLEDMPAATLQQALLEILNSLSGCGEAPADALELQNAIACCCAIVDRSAALGQTGPCLLQLNSALQRPKHRTIYLALSVLLLQADFPQQGAWHDVLQQHLKWELDKYFSPTRTATRLQVDAHIPQLLRLALLLHFELQHHRVPVTESLVTLLLSDTGGIDTQQLQQESLKLAAPAVKSCSICFAAALRRVRQSGDQQGEGRRLRRSSHRPPTPKTPARSKAIVAAGLKACNASMQAASMLGGSPKSAKCQAHNSSSSPRKRLQSPALQQSAKRCKVAQAPLQEQDANRGTGQSGRGSPAQAMGPAGSAGQQSKSGSAAGSRRRITPQQLAPSAPDPELQGSGECDSDQDELEPFRFADDGDWDEAAEAYWSDYIQCKLDLVQQVLQEVPDEGEQQEPLTRLCSSPQSAKRGTPRTPGTLRYSSSDHSKGSTEGWAAMHAAAVQLLCIVGGLNFKRQLHDHPSNSASTEHLMQALLQLISAEDQQKAARAALLYLDASKCIQSYAAACTGAARCPRGSVLMCLAVRLHQALAGYTGDAPVPAFVHPYIRLIAGLAPLAVAEAADLPPGGKSVRSPLELAGEVLQTLLLDRAVTLEHLQPSSITQSLACMLACLPADRKLAFAACTLWSLSQGSFALLDRPCPACCTAADPAWLGLWRSLSGVPQRRAAMTLLLDTLSSQLASQASAPGNSPSAPSHTPAPAADTTDSPDARISLPGEEPQTAPHAGAVAMLQPGCVQPLTDAVSAVCDALVREATPGAATARTLASRDLMRALLPAAVRVQHLCVLGVRLLTSTNGDPPAEADCALADPAEADAPRSIPQKSDSGEAEALAQLAILHTAGTALALAAEGLGSWHRRSGSSLQPHWFSIFQVAAAEMRQPELVPEGTRQSMQKLLSGTSPCPPSIQGELQEALTHAQRQHSCICQLSNPKHPDAHECASNAGSDSDSESEPGSSEASGSGSDTGPPAPQSKNAYVRAALAEGRCPGYKDDGADLDDFIVCQGDRDYQELFQRDFKFAR
ncbi:hypothetical protein WJX73_007020 [Symbiochloris irregularis]|uniref:Uncharacterized protein n=1 Tax=Symbiochloris irregularis TaxID=706552 RepID=A0AAW1PGG7_9CHLO